MEKKINYLARDFASIREELINFSKLYYPQIADSFNDSSVGAWLIDLMAAVGDDLSYHIDRVAQETLLPSANMRKSLLNIARTNNVKIPGAKASTCEVEISCVLPLGNNEKLSEPNWKFAPTLKRTSTVSNGTYFFELAEDVNFAEQFNADGFSNRRFEPVKNGNGVISGYRVYKSVLAYGGKSTIYTHVITEDELKPFMEFTIPDADILNVESIIFKESNNISSTPPINSFYIDEEMYKMNNQDIYTYRFFEVDSLSDLYRFGYESNLIDGEVVRDMYQPNIYEDYDSDGQKVRFYKGKWKPITQKFVTEFTDNGYIKVTFGCASASIDTPQGVSEYGGNIMSNIMNNPMLGVLPKAGWTMYILYRTNGGIKTNLGTNSVTTISYKDLIFNATEAYSTDKTKEDAFAKIRSDVSNSMRVRNITPSLGGKDAPSNEELKQFIKYNNAEQNRCVTINDYKIRLMKMPPKFGCPFRSNVIEENNKVSFSLLNIDSDGKLTSYIYSTLMDNIINYMSHYKSIGDYIEFKSGKIYNLGFLIDIFVDKGYTTSNVVNDVITLVKNYFDINNHEMGEEIFLGDMEKEINMVDGVLSLISLQAYNIHNGGDENSKYGDKSTLPMYVEKHTCDTEYSDEFSVVGGESYRIDIDAIDRVLSNDYNSMFEIKNPDMDICIRVKLR